MLQKIEQPRWYLLLQIQQQKHKNKIWNMFKVNNRHRNDIIDCVMSSRLGRLSGIFIDNFEHILHRVLMFLLLPLNRQIPAGEDTYGTKV